MSASDPNSAIYVTDSEEKIKMKVNKYAFSGGQDSAELQRELGANLEVDVPIKYLNFFLEDDHDLEQIKKGYGDGSLLTGKVKNLLGDVLSELVKRHERARAQVTEEVMQFIRSVILHTSVHSEVHNEYGAIIFSIFATKKIFRIHCAHTADSMYMQARLTAWL